MAKRHRIPGSRTLYLLPSIPDDLDAAILADCEALIDAGEAEWH